MRDMGTMNVELTIEYLDWEKLFRPVSDGTGPRMFDWFDADLEEIRRADPACVWTELDNTDIVSGWHFVNRVNYYITEVPCPPALFVTVIDEDYFDERADEREEDES